MDFAIRNSDLARMLAEPTWNGRFSKSIADAFRSRVQLIDAAADERDLRNWKSLHFEKLKGNRSHQCSVRLNKQWRLILEFEERNGRKIVTAIEDYH